MSLEIKVPNLPESVTDATVAKWHKKVGDTVVRDENLVDLETDKVVLEVPAPASGTLTSISEEEGATVTAGTVLGAMEEGDVAAPEAADDSAEKAPKADDAPAAKPDAASPSKASKADQKASDDVAPSVRRMANEHGIDPSQVDGSGRAGRVTKGDMIRHLSGGGSRTEERVKMSRLRARIAERMKEAQSTAAILTSFNEVDMKAVMDLRARYQDEFVKRHGIKLGFMSFFVKACCEALQRHAVVNASVDGDEVIYHNYQDIGIAVSTERGLVVPVLRNAERMGLADIEQAIAGYADQARTGSIKLEDLQGGTFTITNGGVFGSLMSTPLLNMPQSAILGMHTIKNRPVAVDGEVVIRPMMYIALSYDHRIIDGKDAVQFLVAIKSMLEDPARLLLDL